MSLIRLGETAWELYTTRYIAADYQIGDGCGAGDVLNYITDPGDGVGMGIEGCFLNGDGASAIKEHQRK